MPEVLGICSVSWASFASVSAAGISDVQRLQFEIHYCNKFAFIIVERSKDSYLMRFR